MRELSSVLTDGGSCSDLVLGDEKLWNVHNDENEEKEALENMISCKMCKNQFDN